MNLKYSILLSIVLLFTSCRIGKDYQQAELSLPEYFRNETRPDIDRDSIVHRPHDFFRNTTLLALLDTAFIKNSDLLIAVKNISLAEFTLRTVKLNYLPDLNTQINGSYAKSSKNSAAGWAGGDREDKDYKLSVGLTWDLDIWGKIKREKEETLASYLQTQEVRRAVQTKLVADVAKGYYNLLMLDEQLEIAGRSKELSDSTLHIMKLQYQVGDANSLGIQQIEAQVEQNNILLSQIEQSIGSQENALSLLCGNYADRIDRKLAVGEEFNAIPLDGYSVSALVSRPDIKAAEFSLRAANARVGINQAAMYPALNITLSGGLNSLITSNWFSIPASLFGTVAGGITQPIFNKGRLKAKYEQAKIEREKEVVTFRQTVLEGYSQVSDALKNKQEIEKQFIFAINREKLLAESIQSTNVLFKTGMVNYLEIITVQSAYLQARLQTTQLYTNKALSNIDLYYALGGGWQ